MTLSINYGETEIKDYLRVDIDDELIETFRKAAEEEAETFLNTDFSTVVSNPDGTTTTMENEVPPSVKEWVLNRIAEKYENRGKPVKPDFSTIQRHKVYAFSGFSDAPKTGIVRFDK